MSCKEHATRAMTSGACEQPDMDSLGSRGDIASPESSGQLSRGSPMGFSLFLDISPSLLSTMALLISMDSSNSLLPIIVWSAVYENNCNFHQSSWGKLQTPKFTKKTTILLKQCMLYFHIRLLSALKNKWGLTKLCGINVCQPSDDVLVWKPEDLAALSYHSAKMILCT